MGDEDEDRTHLATRHRPRVMIASISKALAPIPFLPLSLCLSLFSLLSSSPDGQGQRLMM